MTDQVNVLDRGYVRLLDHLGDDLTVVRRARHLPDAPWRDASEARTDAGLIRYLLAHQHASPFEFVEFDFHVKLPIFVARQWLRHRTWNYNEVSARYQELPAEFYLPSPEVVGQQASRNRQGREAVPTTRERALEVGAYGTRCEAAFREYRWLLECGWPRELARCVLPLATYTELSAKTDLRNLLHFLTLRRDEHAQHEIRAYAEAIVTLIRPIVPVCVEAWEVLHVKRRCASLRTSG